MPSRRKTRRPRAAPRGLTKERARPSGAVAATLVFICIAYIAIAAAYALTIPFGQTPDESAHLPFVAYIAEHGHLPVFSPTQGSYEYHQAPLYYAMAAPAFLIGRAVAHDNAYLAVRLFGIVFGLCAIIFTYLLARELCPARAWLALAAAGFVAFLPMQVALSAAVTNDVAAEAPVAAGLWQVVVAMRDGWRWRRVVALGALCGLATLMKSSGIVLLPVAWLALTLLLAAQPSSAAILGRRDACPTARNRDDGGRGARFAGPAARLTALTVIALFVCGWWLARNWRLYGDPLATRAFVEAFGTSRPTPGSIMSRYNLTRLSYAIWVMQWTFASFWGVFGNMRVFMPTWSVYAPLLAVSAGAAGGLARELGDSRGWEAWRRQAIWPLALAAILVLAAFALFNVSFFQAQGRYLFQALPVVAVALVAGWGRLFPTSARSAGYTILWLALMALSALALPLWVLPALAPAR